MGSSSQNPALPVDESVAKPELELESLELSEVLDPAVSVDASVVSLV
jgi:hypothetical protein